MSELVQLHDLARRIYHDALASVNPQTAVRDAVTCAGEDVVVCGSRTQAPNGIYVVALGKAATTMVSGLEASVGDAITAGVISSLPFTNQPLAASRWQMFEGGHPLPNKASLAAAQAAFALLDRANAERAVVVFLVSGGGSAMIEWPTTDDVSLEDLRTANQTLTNCGARISEINSVRRAFSRVKGGGLAARVPNATAFTLIVSDTNQGDEANVASGPTLPPAPDSPDPLSVISKYQLESQLPVSIVRSLKKGAGQSQVTVPHFVLLDNETAVAAAATRASSLGLATTIQNEISEQSIDEGCRLLLESRDSVISGGEFSCPVRGNGRGGRNLETVLRCAIMLDQSKDQCVVLSAGTDGVDGNSPAAGAIGDETTVERARALGMDAHDFLNRSDSYSFFEKLGDLIVTGPTGTNVRDLRIVLRPSL